MTTTNDGGPDFSTAAGGMAGIHPMVMKAARALFAEDMWVAAEDAPGEWESISLLYIEKAQAALTGCGALECLEALQQLISEAESSIATCPLTRVAARAAIAKATADQVYGSAPE